MRPRKGRQAGVIARRDAEASQPEGSELIKGGALGQLTWVICETAFTSYHIDEPERDETPGGKAINPAWYFKKRGGGPPYDMSVYSLHSLTGILGAAKSVTAMTGVAVPFCDFGEQKIKTEADDNSILLLEYRNNAIAVAYATAAGTIGDPLDFSGRY